MEISIVTTHRGLQLSKMDGLVGLKNSALAFVGSAIYREIEVWHFLVEKETL